MCPSESDQGWRLGGLAGRPGRPNWNSKARRLGRLGRAWEVSGIFGRVLKGLGTLEGSEAWRLRTIPRATLTGKNRQEKWPKPMIICSNYYSLVIRALVKPAFSSDSQRMHLTQHLSQQLVRKSVQNLNIYREKLVKLMWQSFYEYLKIWFCALLCWHLMLWIQHSAIHKQFEL